MTGVHRGALGHTSKNKVTEPHGRCLQLCPALRTPSSTRVSLKRPLGWAATVNTVAPTFDCFLSNLTFITPSAEQTGLRLAEKVLLHLAKEPRTTAPDASSNPHPNRLRPLPCTGNFLQKILTVIVLRAAGMPVTHGFRFNCTSFLDYLQHR